ncbi:TPA: regulatory protein RecX [Vibrio harveyi]
MSQEHLYGFAVGLLAKRDYSSGEMRRLLSHHYLDDTRLAEKEISKQLAKLHGLSRIKQELRQKGLDPLVIEQSLEDTDIDWFELCLKAKEKMLRYLQQSL